MVQKFGNIKQKDKFWAPQTLSTLNPAAKTGLFLAVMIIFYIALMPDQVS